jgi:hypothetical protein
MADDVASAAEVLLPCRVGDDDVLRPAGHVFAGIKIAAKHGPNAESAKESVADTRTWNHDVAAGRVQHITGSGKDVQRAENGVAALPIEVVGIGQIGTSQERNLLRSRNQPAWFHIRERLDQSSVDKAEDCGAGCDAKGEHEHGHDAERRLSA